MLLPPLIWLFIIPESFDETLVQEQEPGSSPIGNDPIDLGNNPVVSVQTADPLIRHKPNGKEAIRIFPSQ